MSFYGVEEVGRFSVGQTTDYIAGQKQGEVGGARPAPLMTMANSRSHN